MKFILMSLLLSLRVFAQESFDQLPLNKLTCSQKTQDNQKLGAGILVFNNNGQILGTARRTDQTKFGLIGGKLDAGETFIQGAVREAFEETGLTINAENLHPVFKAYDGPVLFLTFILKDGIEADLKPQKQEGDVDVAWVSAYQIATGAFPKYNLQLFKSLPENLKKKIDLQLLNISDTEINRLNDDQLRDYVKELYQR
jgi:8-oxo-dGTP pyrophosphatase MutT (NUDIX family)